jgi:hypothetical protein
VHAEAPDTALNEPVAQVWHDAEFVVVLNEPGAHIAQPRSAVNDGAVVW